MNRGVNKVILIGNLGNDPEVKELSNNSIVTNISVATSESWKDKQTGEYVFHTEWHRVVLYNRLSEVARDYLRKGRKIYIEGKLKTRQWEDEKSGVTRYSTEIIANQMQMLDSKEEKQTQNNGQSYKQQDKQQPSTQQIEQTNRYYDKMSDDEIPF